MNDPRLLTLRAGSQGGGKGKNDCRHRLSIRKKREKLLQRPWTGRVHHCQLMEAGLAGLIHPFWHRMFCSDHLSASMRSAPRRRILAGPSIDCFSTHHTWTDQSISMSPRLIVSCTTTVVFFFVVVVRREERSAGLSSGFGDDDSA